MDNLIKFATDMNLKSDIEDLPEIEIHEPDIVFNDDQEQDILDDYQYSRRKIIFAIEASEAVLKHAVKDMSNNPGPRPVEAFSSLVKVINDTCGQLITLHDKMKKMETKKDPEEKNGLTKININDIINEFSKLENNKKE